MMATPPPTIMPIRKAPVPAPRRRAGKLSVMIDMAAGARAASPIPTAARAANRVTNEVAQPQATVATLQIKTPETMTSLRGRMSAARPSAMPATA